MANVSVALRVSAKHNKDTEWKESERETGFDAEGRYRARAREESNYSAARNSAPGLCASGAEDRFRFTIFTGIR